VALREAACEVFEVLVHLVRLSRLGDDKEGERVTADRSEVFAEQVGGALAVAGGRGADNLDVMAFPVHLPAAVMVARASGHRVEVGQGEFEPGVGFDGEAQRGHGFGAIGGSLCLPVPRRRPHACGDRAAVVLNGGPGGVQVSMLVAGLTLGWLHKCEFAGVG
jgi:hypothetical protein